MKTARGAEMRGFTLIELLTALIILSLLALMSYRGLDAVLDSREYVKRETEKWRRVTLFLDRFGRDVGPQFNHHFAFGGFDDRDLPGVGFRRLRLFLFVVFLFSFLLFALSAGGRQAQ